MSQTNHRMKTTYKKILTDYIDANILLHTSLILPAIRKYFQILKVCTNLLLQISNIQNLQSYCILTLFYVLKSVKYYNDFKTYTKYVTMYMILDFSKLHMYACSSKHFLNEIESFCPIYSVIRKKSLNIV